MMSFFPKSVSPNSITIVGFPNFWVLVYYICSQKKGEGPPINDLLWNTAVLSPRPPLVHISLFETMYLD